MRMRAVMATPRGWCNVCPSCFQPFLQAKEEQSESIAAPTVNVSHEKMIADGGERTPLPAVNGL